MINKLRSLFITSFRNRILINIFVSGIIAVLVYGILNFLLTIIQIRLISFSLRPMICFLSALSVFIIAFLKLININFKYISYLNENIQKVTFGDYSSECEILYDDELGMLAANINALAATLKQKEEESKILKENEQLAQQAKQNAVDQKNQLITNVAHDLRTPLTTIMGYLDLLRTKDLKQDDIHHYASIAYDKSVRLKNMMDDLFEYTKITNTEVKMDLKIIDIAELMYQMSDEFYPTLEEHDIKLKLHVPNTAINVIGDGHLLARVFENLISNAIKYGDDHSTLTISVVPDEQEVAISVTNEGDPISQKDIPYLFDKFYRSDASRGTTQGGTGLGLAIAQNVVNMHKGDISVESHDHLTTFKVILKRFKKNNDS